MSDGGIRLTALPALGAVTDASKFAGARVGAGLFAATALRDYMRTSAPYEMSITAAPAGPVDEGSILTVFDTSFATTPLAFSLSITGAATLGQPATGYQYTPNASGVYGYLFNSSGHNEDTASNVGRTGATVFRVKVDQYGQGDAVGYNATAFVASTKTGSTSFLANPAGVLFNGDMTAGADGVYLNAGELYLDDAGYDVAGCGWVVNMNRTNAAGAKDVLWVGYRSQSVGTQPVSAHYSGTGEARIGLDLVGCDFGTGQAGIALEAGNRVYLNASTASATNNPEAVTLSTTWIDYDTTSSAIRLVANNIAALQATSAQVSLAVPLLPLKGTLAGLGSPATAYVMAFGTNVRKAAEGAGAGTGLPVFWDGTAWLTFDGVAATV